MINVIPRTVELNSMDWNSMAGSSKGQRQPLLFNVIHLIIMKANHSGKHQRQQLAAAAAAAQEALTLWEIPSCGKHGTPSLNLKGQQQQSTRQGNEGIEWYGAVCSTAMAPAMAGRHGSNFGIKRS
jgi:hypothetical protein